MPPGTQKLPPCNAKGELLKIMKWYSLKPYIDPGDYVHRMRILRIASYLRKALVGEDFTKTPSL